MKNSDVVIPISYLKKWDGELIKHIIEKYQEEEQDLKLLAYSAYGAFQGVCTEDKKQEIIDQWNKEEFEDDDEDNLEFEEIIINQPQ